MGKRSKISRRIKVSKVSKRSKVSRRSKVSKRINRKYKKRTFRKKKHFGGAPITTIDTLKQIQQRMGIRPLNVLIKKSETETEMTIKDILDSNSDGSWDSTWTTQFDEQYDLKSSLENWVSLDVILKHIMNQLNMNIQLVSIEDVTSTLQDLPSENTQYFTNLLIGHKSANAVYRITFYLKGMPEYHVVIAGYSSLNKLNDMIVKSRKDDGILQLIAVFPEAHPFSALRNNPLTPAQLTTRLSDLNRYLIKVCNKAMTYNGNDILMIIKHWMTGGIEDSSDSHAGTAAEWGQKTTVSTV